MDSIWWISLQHDWAEGLAANERVWVSAHHLNHETCHDYLNKGKTVNDTFSSNLVSPKMIKVTHNPSSTTTKFIAPSAQHKHLVDKNVPFSIDMTGSGDLGAASSGRDVVVFESRSGAARRTLSGHVADVECVKFFPSDLVLLTGGNDMSLKIWSIEDGSCPVTLTGHKRPISNLAMIDRGKHILSSSLDGTIKLWSCGTQECLATLPLNSGKVNDIRIFSKEDGFGCVASVCESGALTLHSLHDNHTLQSQFQHSCELTTCCPVSPHYLVAGSVKGEILTVDTRNTTKPLTIHKRSNYAVSGIVKDDTTNRVWCALRDGETFSLLPASLSDTTYDTTSDTTLSPDTKLSCDTTLSAGDCEPICSLAVKNSVAMTSAKDRVIRVYDV